MTDVFDHNKRSEIMRVVRSRENKSTELALIYIFKQNNIRSWRRGYKLFGKPDFVFPKSKIAVFVDGCFWHGHNCRNLTPAQNSDYWQAKIKRNKKRDKVVNKTLKSAGWSVIRIWECQLKEPSRLLRRFSELLINQ